MTTPELQFAGDYWIGYFDAMASRCEVLIDTRERELADHLTRLAQQEALRIQQKFSRYRDNNIIYRINNANGKPVSVDDETAQMLDYAAQCYDLSDGLFDVTSGVLREAWNFDGSDRIPDAKQVKKLLTRIGWHKVKWQSPQISLPAGMQIDLGGIGKEYAVDRTVLLIRQATAVPCLVNYGGDIATTGPRHTVSSNTVSSNTDSSNAVSNSNVSINSGKGWLVGIEQPDITPAPVAKPIKTTQPKIYELKHGAMATSGDSRRYLLKKGKRYSHILNPLTGWPVTDAPRSVTVITDTCTEAGILATLAMLHGAGAEAFLEQQGVIYWCVRA